MTQNKFDDIPFDYQFTKEGKLLIYWQNRLIMTLKGKKAQRFISQVDTMNSQEIQMALAKLTGNFKRGNEREGKNSRNT